MRRQFLAWAILLGCFFSPAWTRAEEAEKANTVRNGSLVAIEYTLSDEKGEVIDSNAGKDPLIYTQGSGQIIPGLEKELAGMKVSDQKIVTVKPEEAYGPVNPQAFREVPREQIPPDAQKAGASLSGQTPDGKSFNVKVTEVKEKTVVLDFNHPLAGKTLSFDVKVVAIKESGNK